MALLQDFRYALRVLVSNPAFTAVAVGTLALGIGANTAIYTAVHHLLFRPYPFLENAERLAAVWQVAPRGNDHNEVSPADFRDWRDNLKSFDHLVSHVWWTGNMTGGERPERIQGFQVSADYFDALGLRPALGRTFVAGEDEPGRDRLVVLSWGLWQRRFGGDSGVLGTALSINGIPRTVIGVMPDGVRYPAPAEMWAPYAPSAETWTRRQAHYLLVTGRLAPGRTIAQARAELATLTGALATQYPETNRSWSGNVRPLVRDSGRQVEPMLAVLMAAVGFVLLIVCANVANLMLARATSRGRELGIRVALGASRARITRLILVESLVIALAGGAGGVLLGIFGVDLLVALVPGDLRRMIAGFEHFTVNGVVLAFTAGLSIVSALLFGLVPALRAARGAAGRESLRSGATTSGLERHRLRRVLVGAEVALALLLLVGAGLTLRTFRHLGSLYPGFQVEGLALTSLALPGRGYPEPPDAARFYGRLVERVAALPGVTAAGAANVVPLCGCNQTSGFSVIGAPPYPPGAGPEMDWRIITPGYLAALRVPLVRGRDITSADGPDAPRVAIVNETLSRRWFPDGEALGRRLHVDGDTTRSVEVVGIVGDVRHDGLTRQAPPEMYLPAAQYPTGEMTIVARAEGGERAAAALLPALRATVLEIDPNQPVYDQRTMSNLLAFSMLQYHFSLRLLAALGVIALLLAGVGIYGVIAQLVAERTREIGIRIVSMSAPRLLVADDQPDVLEALKLLLKGEGFEVETAASPRGVLSALEARDFDALLVDMNYTRDTTSGAEGLDLLSRVQALDGPPPIVVMTAWASIDGAVEAMRRGARDYVEKPWDNRRLVTTLRTQIELGRALRKSQRLELENRTLRREGLPELIAESPAMQPVLRLMERVGPSEANVLILGEHGTGKEVVARWLHASSARADRPMIAVNLGAIPDALFESELFGHVRGAFTDARTDRIGRFELAEGGTLFLDEIANLPLPQQAKLLRVLETGEFERVGASRARRTDVRVVAATNADIQSEVQAGRFREDLLFRLNTVEIRLPPLRERRPDVPLLAAHFLRRYATRYRKTAAEFAPDAMELLLRHSWPGNVRELDHAVERAVLMAEGGRVQARDFGLGGGADGARALDQLSLEEVERVLIQKALTRAVGNVSEAAKALGLSRSALYRRLKRHGL